MRRKRSMKFLLDTNVFIAAFKSGFTKTTELLIELLSNPDYELIANTVLIQEYRCWLDKLSKQLPSIRERAKLLYILIMNRVTLIEPSKEHLEECRPYIHKDELADLYHAATCLKANAILITNDRHFDKIKKAGIIKVWSISKAIKEILGQKVKKE